MDRRINLRYLVSALLLLSVGAGCEQAAVVTPAPTTITVGGSTAMQPVLQALTEEFSSQNPSVLFDLRAGGSALGEARLPRGEIDLAASTLLPQSEDESAGDSDNSDTLVRTPIGIDGVALVTHPGNPLTSLSYTQVRDIFSGHVTDWEEVGGDPGEIVLVSREEGSGARILFDERMMGSGSVSLTAIVMPSSADVAEFVAAHPAAIGYVSMAYIHRDTPAEAKDDDDTPTEPRKHELRTVAIDGVLPDADSLLEQTYLMVQPLYLITIGPPAGRVRQFIDFALGPTGQEIVQSYHVRIR